VKLRPIIASYSGYFNIQQYLTPSVLDVIATIAQSPQTFQDKPPRAEVGDAGAEGERGCRRVVGAYPTTSIISSMWKIPYRSYAVEISEYNG
jgi:hypothetical protein